MQTCRGVSEPEVSTQSLGVLVIPAGARPPRAHSGRAHSAALRHLAELAAEVPGAGPEDGDRG